jgi:general secretion pathway protein C
MNALRPPDLLVQIYQRYGRFAPGVLELALVLLLATASAKLVWMLVPVPDAARWRPAPVQSAATAAAANAVDPQALVASHLFGEYRAPTDPALSEMSEAPDTRLNLTLMGIFAGTGERGSRALISSSDGEEKPYAVGDDVTRGTRLQAIFPDRVILARDGRLETLRMDKDAPPRALAADGAPAPVAAPTGTSQLAQIRATVLADPSKAADYVRVQPSNVDGQMRGYRVYPGRDRSAFAAAGLRPGDLITQVNGIQLDDPSRAVQMLGDLSQAGSVTLVVERGGQQQTVNVNFN